MLSIDLQNAAYNSIPGNLNETDGIDCPICNNKGVIYRVDEAGCLCSRECECMAKRKSLRLPVPLSMPLPPALRSWPKPRAVSFRFEVGE